MRINRTQANQQGLKPIIKIVYMQDVISETRFMYRMF